MKCSEWENLRHKKQVSGFPELGCRDKKTEGEQDFLMCWSWGLLF